MAQNLQNEVERILRSLTLDELKAVATHLQIEGMDDIDNARTVLRSVEDQFDAAADDEARDVLLRGLPIPNVHLANYQRLWDPEQVVPQVVAVDNVGADGGVRDGNGGPDVGQNGGAPIGGGVPLGGQQAGGPPVGGLVGGNGLQGNANNVGLVQQNALPQYADANHQNLQQMANIPAQVNNAQNMNNAFQNYGVFGVQQAQFAGGFPQQNPWNFGGVQQQFGAQNFGPYHQNLQPRNPQFPVFGHVGPQLNVNNQNLQQMANIPAQVAAVPVQNQNVAVQNQNIRGLNVNNQNLQQMANIPAQVAAVPPVRNAVNQNIRGPPAVNQNNDVLRPRGGMFLNNQFNVNNNQNLQQMAPIPAQVAAVQADGQMNQNQNYQQNAQVPVQGAAAIAGNVGGFDGNQGVLAFPNPQQRVMQMFPREFRMTGSISDDIEKSNEYLDICRQVTDGQRKGYSEVEIMSGLRRIMSPGAVKTYVDSRSGVPLAEVMLFLRSFLKVRTPAELNNELSHLVQKEDEPAIKFFMNAIKLRQLLVVGSQMEGSVTYHPQLVQSTFLHTIRTGLRDEAVRTYMLPYLSETHLVNDNLLIQELHKAVAEAEERKMKTKGVKTAAKVNTIDACPEFIAVMKKLEDNQNQMRVMQEQMKELLKVTPNKKNDGWKKPGCQNCQDNNTVATCRHCWKCGEEGHKAQEKDKCKEGK